jgi:uncharacterized protein YqgV (UPF0045/DUF77 family)
MRISIDISYYPLTDEFIPHVLDFIDRISGYEKIEVQRNGMSTQVFGKYFEVMETLTKEIHQSFELPHSVFILKVINADLQKHSTKD